MNSNLEERLRASFRSADLPEAPDSLRDRIQSAADRTASRRPTRRVGRGWLLLPVAALIAVALGAALLSVGARPPTNVDGLPVMSVSQVLDARAAGGLRNQSVAVGGYWSDGSRSVYVSCAAPVPWAQPGELELYCTDGLWGITELKEPVIVIDRDGYETPPSGPHLTPFIPNDLPGSEGLYSLPRINGERYLLVPIVVVGHFDDQRAAQCRPAATQLCLDRLVVDKIAYFNPAAARIWVSTSTPLPPVPTPTAVPVASTTFDH
jgi:hypothetical protein